MRGVPVELNVYDLAHPDNPDAVPNLNWYLYGLGMGLYHSGVCVYGIEHCYGGHPEEHTGVFQVRPKKAPDARFRQTIFIGRTELTAQQVSQLVEAMAQVWKGNTYNLLTRNCNHFASDLCEKLTGNPAPEWINRLAWVGEKAKFLLPKGFDTPTAAPVREERVNNEADDLLNMPDPSENDPDFLGEDVTKACTKSN